MDLRRVAVVGTSCSGKTTFAAALAARLQVRHIELDALHWGPDWTPIPHGAFREAVAAATAAERWICDGNYGAVRDLVWRRATAVIWLDYAFPHQLLAPSAAISGAVRAIPVRASARVGFQEIRGGGPLPGPPALPACRQGASLIALRAVTARRGRSRPRCDGRPHRA